MKNVKALNMLQLNMVHLDTRKILAINNLDIIHVNFEKKSWQEVLPFTARDRLTDWLFSYD